MKKIYYLIIITLFLLLNVSLFSQSEQFIKYYGADCPDFGLSLDKTTDGGYILLGHTQNFGAQIQDVYLIKIDSSGNEIWHKLFGGSDLDFGQSVQQTTDKGFILCGFTKSFGAGGNDIYIIKTDSSGNFLWQQTYGGTNDDYGYCIKQTPDKGYIICGSTKSFGSGGTDAILIKTDSSGTQQWLKYYGGVNNDGAYSLDITSDAGYVLCGYTYNFGALNDDAMVIKTDAAGNQQWLKIFGGSSNDRALSIKQCADKGFCFAGYTNSFGNGTEDMYLVRTDSSGNQLYYKTYGGSQTEKAYSLDLTLDNGFILTGQTNSYGAGNDDLYVVKADSTGNVLWEKYFGGTENDEGFTVKATSDKGFIAIGNTWSYNIMYSDIYVVKMDSTGYATGISFYNTGYSDFNIYPNPANNNITIETGCNASIEIFNIQGQLIKSLILNDINTTINVSAFQSGVYTVKMIPIAIGTEKKLAVKKFVKE